MENTHHLTMEQLQAGLDDILQTPKDLGTLELIVGRPAEDERIVLEEGRLDVDAGLIGDGWRARGSEKTPDGSADLKQQVSLMNSRVIGLLAGGKERWPLAGDQLYVDLDLSTQNLPPGTTLSIGTALVVVTDAIHSGCEKFLTRFGAEAHKFVNSPSGREHNLRGIYAKVIRSGIIRPGDTVAKSGSAGMEI